MQWRIQDLVEGDRSVNCYKQGIRPCSGWDREGGVPPPMVERPAPMAERYEA